MNDKFESIILILEFVILTVAAIISRMSVLIFWDIIIGIIVILWFKMIKEDGKNK